MKKLLITLGLVIALTGCNKKTTTKNNDTNKLPIETNYSFEDVIKRSNYIVSGTLKNIKTGSNILDNTDKMPSSTRANYSIYTFDITSTIYDSYGLNKNKINIYSENDLKFKEGIEYLLPATLVDYAYFVEDIFTIPGCLTLSFTDYSNNTINDNDRIISKTGTNYSAEFNKEELTRYINGLEKGKLKYYTKETSKEKIIDNSPIILKIKVKDLSYTRDTDYAKCETFVVEIIDVIKGEKIETTEDIKIEFLKDSVKKDDVIIVGVEAIGKMVISDGMFYKLISNTILLDNDLK